MQITPKEFLTNWTINYVKRNYNSLNITYDGAYGFDDFNRWGAKLKVKLSKLVKDLKKDFGIVEWVLLEVLNGNETIVTKDTTKVVPIMIYNLDGTLIKATSVDKPNLWPCREWYWEYYTRSTTMDIYQELRNIGLTHDHCDAVEDLINKIKENQPPNQQLNISDVMKRYQEIKKEYSDCMSNYIKTGSNIYLDRAKEIEIIFDFFKR